MPAYSKFQKLPVHIAEKIACYIFGCSQDSFPYYGYTIENAQTLPALYEISQLWRDIVLRYSCSLIKLTLSAETNAHSWRFLGKHAPAEHNGTNNLLYVKDVWVKIDRSCLRDAELGLQLLDNSWSSSYTFPSARRLKIEYYDAGCGYDTSSAEVEDEVIAVIIKRAFSQLPKLQEVYIACTVNSEHVDNREYQSIIAHGIDKVLTMAFLKTKRLNINGINLWMAKSPLHMYGGVGLTHLVLRGNHNAGIYQHIIKRNAPTLNTLVVQSGLYSAVQDLLIDEGNIIIYPRLETLELDYFPDDENAPGHKIDKAVAPFPNLNRLCWDGLYPFSDDTLFRGNSSTLTYLSMDMRGKLLQIAQEYKIFYQGSHPKLRHIISTDCYGDPTSEHLDTPTYLQFTLDLVSPSTQTLGLNTLYKAQTFLREIPQYPHMLNIQVLNMYDSELTLSDIINLLKQLPNLTYLETNFGGIGAEIEEIDFNNLINQPYSLHYPLSNYFNCLCVLVCMENYKHYKSFALAVIVLAVLCPRFTFISLDKAYQASCLREAKAILATKSFSVYSERVQHLFRN